MKPKVQKKKKRRVSGVKSPLMHSHVVIAAESRQIMK